MVGVWRRIGQGLTSFAKPGLHECDLVRLRGVDALGQLDQGLTIRAPLHQCRHLDGLAVVMDHVLHEPHVVWRKPGVRDLDRLLGAELPRRLAWCTGLKDRHLLRHSGARRCSEPA